jgi:Straboviridae/Kyanoviridae head completion nuclease
MGHYKQGEYKPINPDKYAGNINKIRYLSSWELVLMKFFDLNEHILEWNSEDIIIPYYSNADQKKRRYIVDFYVKYKNKKGEIVKELLEVKPKSQTIQPKQKRGKKKSTYLKEAYTYQVNIDKWRAATKYAKDRKMTFRLITEDHIFT